MDTIVQINADESLTIAQVAEWYARFLAVLAEGQAVTIDLSQIERVDTAALQLLYSFHREAMSQELVILWGKPSQVFCDAVAVLGMPPFYVED